MTRPGIVRADTLDLQDQDAPSAQDHSQHHLPQNSTNGGIGPHQASEIRNVRQERHSEELNLQEAWNQAQSPTTQHQQDHDDDFTEDQLHAQHNGIHGEDGEHTDDEEAEQSSDDDMMDRMSSSPSIDDGAYPMTPCTATSMWPPRSSSLTPTRGTLNRSSTSSIDSSPFVDPPEHLPLTMSMLNHDDQSPASTTRLQNSSPCSLIPKYCPLFPKKTSSSNGGDNSTLSFNNNHHHHHLHGEYSGHLDDEGFHEDYDLFAESDSEDDNHAMPDPLNSSFIVNDSYIQPRPVTTLARSTKHAFTADHFQPFRRDDSPDMTDIRHLLLPHDDLLLDEEIYGLEEDSTSSTDSSSSWATVSDASPTRDQYDPGNSDELGDDDSDDLSFYADERFVDSGWGGECLRETEDIDFDFVYALHTFVATVEGQANATKGDTMVLLDDSNSYWWLVRIVKDSSIGYLPAEHIETPTERLARLNKHRNVDLSQAMLGDNMEKSKNPLKKAMRRRNAKTVQFAAPTYVEASDYEYDTEDEENALLADVYTNGSVQAENGDNADHAEHRESSDGNDELKSRMSDSSSSDDAKDVKPPSEEPLGSPTFIDSSEAAPLKSRKGTPRNADSFLKDENTEPRRITLTPNILRDDGSGGNSLEKTRSSSFDSLEKITSPTDKPKEDKKKKEKKQGMLSGLFKSKKKEKKSGKDEDVMSDGEKVSGEHSRQNSGQGSPILERNSSLADKKGRLQKTQPTVAATAQVPVREVLQPVQPPPLQIQQQQLPQQNATAPSQLRPAEDHPTQFYAELEGSQVAYEAPTGQEDQIRDIQSRNSTRSPDPPQPQLQQSSSMAALTAITNRMRPSSSDEPQVKKQKVKKAKKRVELDDFDELSEDEEQETGGERLSESPVEITHGTFMHGTESVHIPTYMEEDDDSTQGERTPDERASEEDDRTSSPSMLDMPTEGDSLDPSKRRFEADGSEATDTTDDDPTPIPSKAQSPDTTIYTHQPGLPNLQQSPTPPPARSAPFPPATRPPPPTDEIYARAITPSKQIYPQRAASLSSTTSTQPSPSLSPVSAADSAASKDTANSWSNASLRAWLDGGEGNDIRDMLVVIHDKSDVTPVGADHPLMRGLWDEERNACGRMMGELDGLLGSFLGKKRQPGSVKGVTGVRNAQSVASAAINAPVVGA